MKNTRCKPPYTSGEFEPKKCALVWGNWTPKFYILLKSLPQQRLWNKEWTYVKRTRFILSSLDIEDLLNIFFLIIEEENATNLS